MIFSHQDILFLAGFAIGTWLSLFFGPSFFEAVARFFKKPLVSPPIVVSIGLDASAFRAAVQSAQSAIANLQSETSGEGAA